jgi:ribosomal-protein-alanine N-acetyltransferase
MRWWDIAGIVPVERELFGPTAWSEELFWAEMAHPRFRQYLIAEDDDGILCGYAGVQFAGAEADVQTLAVPPQVRGRGVGGILLRDMIARAARGGASSLLLEVRADNGPAISLYSRHGFTRIAVRRGYYQPEGVDAWVMRLRPLPPVDGAGATLPG